MKGLFYERPRLFRAMSLACVAAGALFFIRIVQLDERIAILVKAQAENARAASDALGG